MGLDSKCLATSIDQESHYLKGMSVLDVAAGTGAGALYAASRGASSVVATDFSENMLHTLQSRINAGNACFQRVSPGDKTLWLQPKVAFCPTRCTDAVARGDGATDEETTPRQRPRPKLLLSLRTHIVQPSLPALHASDSRPGRRASGLGRERINTGRSRQLLGSFCAGVAQPEAVRGNLPESRRGQTIERDGLRVVAHRIPTP